MAPKVAHDRVWVTRRPTDTVNAGYINAERIDRDQMNDDRDNFHMVCDAESADLQAVGVQFCDRRGSLRLEVNDPAADRGGFLHISSFSVPTEYRQNGATDVAAEALVAPREVPGTSGHAPRRPGWLVSRCLCTRMRGLGVTKPGWPRAWLRWSPPVHQRGMRS